MWLQLQGSSRFIGGLGFRGSGFYPKIPNPLIQKESKHQGNVLIHHNDDGVVEKKKLGSQK